MKLKPYILSIFILLTFSCSYQNAYYPEWVNATSSQSDWVGVGIVSKPFNGDIREAARLQAIKEISSQIEININSNMVSIIEENNYNINQYTKSIIEARIENSFSNLKFEKYHEDKESYYALVKLSKKNYYDELNKAKQNATDLAIGLVDKTAGLSSINSIVLLKEALNEIINYLDDPIIVEYPASSKNSVNLYSMIKSKMIDSINNIKIQTNLNKMSIRSGWVDANNKIIIQTVDKITGKAISNVPIRIYSGEESQVITNDEGIAEYIVSPSKNQSSVEFSLNLNEIGISESILELNKTQLLIEQVPLKIFVNSVEKNLDDLIELNLAEPLIKEYLSKKIFVEFTPREDADLIIQFTVNTNKKSDIPNEYGIYQTFGLGTLSVYDRLNDTELFSMSSENIYGAHFNSNYESGINTIEKIISKMISEAQSMIDVLSGKNKIGD